jgi:hypothetical protein
VGRLFVHWVSRAGIPFAVLTSLMRPVILSALSSQLFIISNTNLKKTNCYAMILNRISVSAHPSSEHDTADSLKMDSREI